MPHARPPPSPHSLTGTIETSPLQIRHTYPFPKPFRVWFSWLALGACPHCTDRKGVLKFHRHGQGEGRTQRLGAVGILSTTHYKEGSACAALKKLDARYK